jgi:hypothetical protein
MVNQGLAFYEELKQRGQIKALTWRGYDARQDPLDLPGRRVAQIKLPDLDEPEA